MKLEFRFKGHDNVVVVEGSADALAVYARQHKIVICVDNPRPSHVELEAAAKQTAADWHQFVGTYEPLLLAR